MATVAKSVLVSHPAERMFALVDGVEEYPEFLPWCSSTKVFERSASITRARLDIDYHGLRTHISTFNRKEAPLRMTLELVDGPFERFAGEWRFVPLGGEGCREALSHDYVLSSKTVDRVLAPVFGYIMETLVDRFVARADEVS